AFYLRFERNGQDLYPLIRQVVADGRVPADNRVRYEMLTRLGYFVTESSEHFSEYVPWFIKRDRLDLIDRYNIPLDEYIARCEDQIAGWDALAEHFEQSESSTQQDLASIERYEEVRHARWVERTARTFPDILEEAQERADRKKAEERAETQPRQVVRHSGEYA